MPRGPLHNGWGRNDRQMVERPFAALHLVVFGRNQLEQVVTTAVIAAGIFAILATSGLAFFHITLIAVLMALLAGAWHYAGRWRADAGVTEPVTPEPTPSPTPKKP